MNQKYSNTDKLIWMWEKILKIDKELSYVRKWDFEKIDFNNFKKLGLETVYVNILKAQIEINEWEIKMDRFADKNLNGQFKKWYPTEKAKENVLNKIKKNKELLKTHEPVAKINEDRNIKFELKALRQKYQSQKEIKNSNDKELNY